MIFGKMALNYKYMNEIEPKINAMKTLMGSPTVEDGGIEATDTLSRRIKGKIVPFLTKEGRTTETFKLFQDIMDAYLYGVKFKEKSAIPGVDAVHYITKLKNYNSVLKLGFAITPAAGALIAGHTGSYVIGKKGIAYTSNQLIDAYKDIVLDRKGTNALAGFFDPYNDDYSDREFQKYKTTWKNKSLDRFMFAFLRRADVSNTKKVIIAMAKNFGVDENGNIVRLNKPGIDASKYKTIQSLAKIDKDGNFSIEGMGKDGFIQFVASIKETMGGIIGNMNPDDLGRPDTGLIQNQFFAFRSWMPAVVEERLGSLKYREATDSLQWGRFRAYASEYGHYITDQEMEDGKKISMYITHVLLPNLGKLVLDLTTFGLVPGIVKGRVNMVRAERAYNKFIEENKHLKDKVNFDMYLEIKQGQIKAMLVEARIILSLLGLLIFLSGVGDDGKKRYQNMWITRTGYKILNKAGSEMTFMWNPKEFERLMKNPFPTTSLITQAINTLSNTLDESRDLIFGENSTRDMTPKMYYTLQWFKGAPQMMRFWEVYKSMERSPYQMIN
jgi:hypothetical protein